MGKNKDHKKQRLLPDIPEIIEQMKSLLNPGTRGKLQPIPVKVLRRGS